MSDAIKLNFINHSNDANNSEVVIFQKNVATDFDELAVAWRVIKNCGQGDNHPFNYPFQVTVSASDSYGNYTPQLDAQTGQSFHVYLSSSGTAVAYKGAASSPNEIELLNDLQKGAVTANIYRDGKLIAVKTNVAPGQKAVFEFKPIIYIGVASQVEEGQVMNSAIISSINTEISLLGLKSADIVMTGGDPGADATPFEFTLENVVYA